MPRTGVRPETKTYPFKNEHARPRMWGGVQWQSWQTGVCRHEHRTPCGRGSVAEASSYRMTYVGRVDGQYILGPSGRKAKAFRTQEAAALAVLKQIEASL